MWRRPGLLLLVVASLTPYLPGSYQYPQHVVFQPVTYQLTSMGQIDPDFSPVSPPNIRVSPEGASNQLICKKIQHGDGLFRFSPSTLASQLFFIPSPIVQPLIEGPFSRFLVGVPSVGVGAEDIPPEIPEGALAAPPPLMASLCVSQDSPRPFPVLFASPPQVSSIDGDFKDSFMNTLDAPFYSRPTSESGDSLKVSLNTPSMGGVTLGLEGVPATIESSSPSADDLSGRVVVKLHTIPPGRITLGFTGDGRTARTPGTGRAGQAVTPSVSLVFSRPVGSIGIGSTNSPAVNIEKQNIISSAGIIPNRIIPKDWTSHKGQLYLQ